MDALTVTPILSRMSIPTLPSLTLTAEEQGLLRMLAAQCATDLGHMQVSEAYYLGEQHIRNLRIAVPKELEFLRTIVGWPSYAVDPYVERLALDGFRLPGATDADPRLTDLMVGCGLDGLLPLATQDALSLGRGYWMGMTDPEGGDLPVISVQSPLNTAVLWDDAGRRARAVWSVAKDHGRYYGYLALPDQTITLAPTQTGMLEVVDRDQHGAGFLPFVRMPHQPSSRNPGGRSAITPAIRSLTDSACRDLLAIEVSREFYAIPRVTLLGAAESDFQDASGNPKTGWETLITKYNAIERDEEGNLPQIHQLTAYDPSTFTKVFDMRASQMAALVAAPPQDLGLYTSGNPVSADAVGAMETRRNRRARRMQAEFGRAMSDLMKMILRFTNGGELPAEFARIETDWVDVEMPSLSGAADAVSKLTAGVDPVLPPHSDVTLRMLGLSAVDRAWIAQDRKEMQDKSAADAIVAALHANQVGQVTRGLDGQPVEPPKQPPATPPPGAPNDSKPAAG